MQVIFPTTTPIANTIPANGNTVPISGLQGITNSSELLAYAALAYENANNSDQINFGGLTGVLFTAQVNKVQTQQGEMFLQIIAFVPLKSDYAAFPDGKKLWKQVSERLPNQAASSSFNF